MKFYLLLLATALAIWANAQVLRYDSGKVYSHDIAIASVDTLQARAVGAADMQYYIRDMDGRLLLSMRDAGGAAQPDQRLYELRFRAQDKILFLPLSTSVPISALLAQLESLAASDITPQDGLEQYLDRMVTQPVAPGKRVRRSEFGALELPREGVIVHNGLPVASYRLVEPKKKSVICEFYQRNGALIATVKLKTTRDRFMTELSTKADEKVHQVRLSTDADTSAADSDKVPHKAHILAAAQWLTNRKYL